MSSIEWIQENNTYQWAHIGTIDKDYVVALIAGGKDGIFHWETCISPVLGFDLPIGWMVGAGETTDLREAQDMSAHYGREWIRGDSLIWDESGGND